jgi:hydrophobe/amphiphile efflux-3 (HAE3) family protein
VRFGDAARRITAWCIDHARIVIAVCALLAVAGAIAALRLPTDAGTDTLVDHDSATYRATQRFKRLFGDDAVVVLVKGDLRKLVLTKNLDVLLNLEACLSGQGPQGGRPLPGVCTEISGLGATRVVYGPATFLNQAVVGIQQLLAGQLQAVQAQAKAAEKAGGKAAGQAVLQQFQGSLLRLGARYGIDRLPSLQDPLFVSQVVFDIRRPVGTPKARFSYLFPSSRSALISARLRPGLSDSRRKEAIGLFRRAVADQRFKLDEGSYVVSGVPVVVEGLSATLKTAILVLLAAAVAVMALTLALVFGPPLRLLPLLLALAAAGMTFGLLSATGGSLTMASIAVLPVLVGLAVDYAIQFQARFNESRRAGVSAREAAVAAAARGAPVIGTACLATAAGFAVLLLSPVPMVRSFGLLLVIGIGIALLLALTMGLAVLSRLGNRQPWGLRLPRRAAALRDRGAAGRARAAGLIRGAGKHSLGVAISNPTRVLAVAAALAACGWIAGTQTPVVSDLRELVPRDLPALQGVNELQSATGVSGELDVTVTAPDITDGATLEWMRDYQRRVLARHGFQGEFPSCAKARLCPAASLSDLFASGTGELTAERARALLAALPRYASQAVVTRNPRTGEIGHTANIAFGIRVMPLDDQQRLIEDMRRQIDPPGEDNGPPPGVEAQVAGLPALAAQANSSLSSSRYWLTLAGLVAVALALLAALRSRRRALVPLVPIVLASGWSALVLAAMDIPLNPMSATLGALVTAIATEFSVLLSSRYWEEREGGRSIGEALRHSYAMTGTAVLASGATAIAGFAALIVSDIRMLRDFGLVTVVDLGVALIGVMLVLPAVLVLAEERFAELRSAAAGIRPRLAALRPARR